MFCIVRWLAFALLASAASIGFADGHCDICNIRLQHRTGAFKIIIAGDATHRSKTPWYVNIAIVNGTHAPPLRIDPDRAATSFQLTAFGPSYSMQERGHVSETGTKLIQPGERFTFAPKALQDWGLPIRRPGAYRVSLAYDGVDSNVYAFRVYR